MNIPVTLELAQSAYPEEKWILGYRVAPDFKTLDRVVLSNDYAPMCELKWKKVSSHLFGGLSRWVLMDGYVESSDGFHYATHDEMMAGLRRMRSDYEELSELIRTLEEEAQSPVTPSGDVV